MPETLPIPSYLQLSKSGELGRRVLQAWDHLLECDGCGWQCKANRRAGELGKCRTGEQARVCSFGPHLGEERPLSGWYGSGTIFFGGCNLQCVFCQNYTISQLRSGEEVDAYGLAGMMIALQEYGCHNINLVSPSHVVPQILAGVALAAQKGLHLPLVYNSGGYDSARMLGLLDGVIDIYMPDMKYADAALAAQYSGIPDYPRINQIAVREMHRQVGDLEISDGLAVKGLLVRHLVLPNRLAGTAGVVRFLAEEISTHTYLNLMDQYYPAYQAHRFPALNRRITQEEYQEAIRLAKKAGLHRLDGRAQI